MNFGTFAGGLNQGIQQVDQANRLKKLMTTPQPIQQPGYEDPMQGLSVAGPGDFNPQAAQIPNPGVMQQLMKLFGGGGY